MTSGSNESQLLLGISARARRLLQRLGPANAATQMQAGNSSPPTDFTFLEPQTIKDHLIEQGLSCTAAQRLSNVYRQHAGELKREYERSVNIASRACSEAAANAGLSPDTSSIRTLYASLYDRALRQWMATGLKSSARRVSEILSSRDYSSNLETKAGRRNVFKQDAIAMLETVFKQNAYPCRSEKQTLAERTGTDIQQVHVWFQNRRSRSKRDQDQARPLSFINVKELDCIPSPVLTHLGLQNCLLGTCSGEDLGKSKSALDASDPFYSEPAAHAFPGPYPPSCDYDPFPLSNGSPHLCTTWIRRPSQFVRRTEFCASDIDEISTALKNIKLTDGEAGPMSQSGHVERDSEYGIPCLPTLIRPPSAPLSALVRVGANATPYEQNNHHFPRQISSQHVSSKRVHGLASQHVHVAASERPVSSLPRRKRKSKQASTREGGRPYLPTSSPHHQLRRSRLSSSNSLSSICSDSSSSSMSSSQSSRDSPLLTPPQRVVEISHLAKLPTSPFALGSAQNFDQLFSSPLESSWPYAGIYLDVLSC